MTPPPPPVGGGHMSSLCFRCRCVDPNFQECVSHVSHTLLGFCSAVWLVPSLVRLLPRHGDTLQRVFYPFAYLAPLSPRYTVLIFVAKSALRFQSQM